MATIANSTPPQSYAVAVGAMAAITALVYMPLTIFAGTIMWLFAWDLLLFILWIAVFGLFASLYLHENPEGDGGVQRMKNAMWIDLVNMLLWFITGVGGVVAFFSAGGLRGGKSKFTGRAQA